MLYKKLYSEIGKLLYAVADVDGVITEKEKEALHNMVTRALVPFEKQKDVYGTNLAYYTEFEFDFLDEQIADTKAAFDSFIDFIEDHYAAIDEHMLSVCINLVKELASAYYGSSKMEEKLINELSKRLEKIDEKVLT